MKLEEMTSQLVMPCDVTATKLWGQRWQLRRVGTGGEGCSCGFWQWRALIGGNYYNLLTYSITPKFTQIQTHTKNLSASKRGRMRVIGGVECRVPDVAGEAGGRGGKGSGKRLERERGWRCCHCDNAGLVTLDLGRSGRHYFLTLP